MTLYLLFERLEAGKIKLSTRTGGVRHASSRRRPSSACKPGETIEVEDAIQAIVTKSANDVAVVVAEALGGSERDFARLMTAQGARARHDAHHLPQCLRPAGRRPDHHRARPGDARPRASRTASRNTYHYFSTRSFVYRGQRDAQPQPPARRVEGVDGIKTGYTRDSGFNLVTSVRRGNRHIVAVVFGGRTAGWRDARMREPDRAAISRIASLKRSAPLVVERWRRPAASLRAAPAPARRRLGRISRCRPPRRRPPPPRSSARPRRSSRIAVKTVTVMVAPNAQRAGAMLDAAAGRRATRWRRRRRHVGAMIATACDQAQADPAPLAAGQARAADHRTGGARARAVPIPAEPAAKPRAAGYMIQVGAFDDEGDAKDRLAAAHNKARARTRRGRSVHRTGRQGRQDALPRALRRPRQDAGRSRLQTPQAQRHPVLLAEELSARDNNLSSDSR